jgi:YqjK-like protein
MNSRLHTIQQRRATLVARAEAQRQDVRELFAVWSGPISVVDRVAGVFQRLYALPLIIPAGAVLLLWLRRSRKWVWSGRLWTVWQLVSSLRHLRASRHSGISD